MANKVEIEESDLKRLLLMVKLSKDRGYINVASKDLTVYNMWRVSEKMVGKITRKLGYSFVENKGRVFLKSATEESVKEEKVHRCRKRKTK